MKSSCLVPFHRRERYEAVFGIPVDLEFGSFFGWNQIGSHAELGSACGPSVPRRTLICTMLSPLATGIYAGIGAAGALGYAMTWMVSDFGMQMTLSRKVPDHIRACLGPFLDRMGAAQGLGAAGLAKEALFA